MPIPFYHPQPKPPAAFGGQPLPLGKANILSKIVFQWVTPIMQVGYSRPLQSNDLWMLTDDLQCQNVANQLEAALQRRLPPSRRIVPTRPADSSEEKLRCSSIIIDGISSHQAEEAAQVAQLSIPVPAITSTVNLDQALAVEAKFAEKPILVTPPQSGSRKAPLDPDLVKRYGKRVTRKIISGDSIVENGAVYDMSLLRSMFSVVWKEWLVAVILNLFSASLQVTAPLVTKEIITQLTLAYTQNEFAAIAPGLLPEARSVGYGIGLAFALFVMLMAASLLAYQATQRAAVIGFLMRASLIDLISRKSMRLSTKSRNEMTNGRLTTMVSADASFLDFAVPLSLNLVSQPIQIVVGIALLIWTLGYSALVGFGVVFLALPFQYLMFFNMISTRRKQITVVDKRVRLLSEVISNIRAVKLYSYEAFFGEKVTELRTEELDMLRKNGANRAIMFSSAQFVPVLAIILTFITYSLSGNPLDPATVFSGLQYFNVIKTPIMFLPLALMATTDAVVGVGRIGKLLQCEELKRDINIHPSLPHAVDVQGSFQFPSVQAPDTTTLTGAGDMGDGGIAAKIKAMDKKKAEKKKAKEQKSREKKGLPPLREKVGGEITGEPFALRNIQLQVPRGALVCIVGRIGTGKSALLNGMINEMQLLDGHVTFGGPVSYVPQNAWVQSGTIRENITFSARPEEVDLSRVNEVINACGLRPDIDMLPDGDLTRIGEKGITLSGGQRQRICLARAAYSTSSQVVLLDDPLSAVDAHVGHHLLHQCILNGPLGDRTRILVTHHLDVLPHADMVIVMDRIGADDASIVQQGTYAELRRDEGLFRALLDEFAPGLEEDLGKKSDDFGGVPKKAIDVSASEEAPSSAGKLILDEEREIGAVSWHVYLSYARAMGGVWWALAFSVCLILTQAASVLNSLFLGFWTGSTISGFSTGEYMAVYACLGVALAVFTFGGMFIMILAGLRASKALFNGAWFHVMRSPTQWHDRTPSGRIISRLSKDIEMLDDRLSFVWNQLLQNALDVLGTFALVVYTFPYLGLIFIPLSVLYYLAATYYRKTSREVKRVDSISRSAIYQSFGEQLSGLAVIRAFGQQDNYERRLQSAVNTECEAYIITITIQRWLGVRLDLMSNALILFIAIFAAVFRTSDSPSRIGVVLTYTLASASVFSQLVQLFAQVEQEMNNVERIQHYNDLPMEADPRLPTDPVLSEGLSSWPSQGEVIFKDVDLRYRSDLPLVLKNINLHILPGEKIGIVGRTGEGKSSIAQALFRTIEVSSGSITIDGLVLAELGLDTVRNSLAIIPQDPFLFGGTVRENIDPRGICSDAQLNDALNLIRNNHAVSASLLAKFKLDTIVQNEGANFSAGERQLLAVVRAVTRGSKVLMLDEATSSVDQETDALIQRIIQTEFADVTLICIAHRLQTVAYCDRIIVLDAGRIAEFDNPIALYDDPESAFRNLCQKARVERHDLVRLHVKV